jgi:glycosyltransferase involved in cell wall biosynthesis
MRIAQVPPLYESVPPLLYGGTERVVSYLTEELVNQGHEVTLFGTKDSVTRAKLFPVCEQAIRLSKDCKDPLAWHIYQMQLVLEQSDEFEVIHFHNDYLHFPFSRLAGYNHITTLHGRLDLDDLKPIYRMFHDIPLVSISNNQRQPFSTVNWIGTVYHGLPQHLYRQGRGDGGYLAFLGRISPEKRPDRAIEIAKRAGIPLKIAAKVDAADLEYYKKYIEPLLDHPLIEYIGEIGEDKKGAFLGNAMALVFPIDWPEPFGMAMIEALANGTPVIGFNCGSVPEIIDHGKTGFIVNNIDQALEAVDNLHLIDRNRCRNTFEQLYTATTMAENYVLFYEALFNKRNRSSKMQKLFLKHQRGKVLS